MSIWTDLLFLHGHIATPAALALVVRAEASTAVLAAPDITAHRRNSEIANPADERYIHPLRATGQLR